MLIRKIAKILRGKATPFQLGSACVLAALIGFMPGFTTAGGLILALLMILVILNANLALGALVGILAKLLSWLLMPVSFAIGRFLLEGPTESIFRSLVNAPVFAWFGFEYYVTTGGLVLGLVFGLVCAALVIRSVSAYRRKMKDLESNSEKYKTYSQKKSVKLITWLLLGGAPKKVDFDQLLSRKIGNPIRLLGVVLSALIVLLVVIIYNFAAEPLVTFGLRSGLESANGATVDLERAELNLKENRLSVIQLAMADPNDLASDLFRAKELTADISGEQLLRKRLQLDKVVVTGGSSGEPRRSPGVLVGPPPEPQPAPPDDKFPDAKTLDDYLENAKVWKERLAQVRRWLEKLEGSGETDPETVDSESWSERLEREIREKGYAKVRAAHLIEDSPTFTVLELTANEVTVRQLPGELLNISALNLSTHPGLLGAAPELSIQAQSGKLGLSTRLGHFAPEGDPNGLSFHYLGLPVERVAGQLSIGGTQPLSGGTVDMKFDGTLQLGGTVSVDLPLQITLHDTTLQLPGMGPQPVEEFILPVGVRGPLDNPRLSVDDNNLQDALVQAGVSRLKEELGNKAQEEIGKQLEGELGEQIGEQGKQLLDGLFKKKN